MLESNSATPVRGPRRFLRVFNPQFAQPPPSEQTSRLHTNVDSSVNVTLTSNTRTSLRSIENFSVDDAVFVKPATPLPLVSKSKNENSFSNQSALKNQLLDQSNHTTISHNNKVSTDQLPNITHDFQFKNDTFKGVSPSVHQSSTALKLTNNGSHNKDAHSSNFSRVSGNVSSISTTLSNVSFASNCRRLNYRTADLIDSSRCDWFQQPPHKLGKYIVVDRRNHSVKHVDPLVSERGYNHPEHEIQTNDNVFDTYDASEECNNNPHDDLLNFNCPALQKVIFDHVRAKCVRFISNWQPYVRQYKSRKIGLFLVGKIVKSLSMSGQPLESTAVVDGNDVWYTSPITGRFHCRIVASKSSIYVLIGNMFVDSSLSSKDLDIPSVIQSQFSNGFPVNWNEYIDLWKQNAQLHYSSVKTCIEEQTEPDLGMNVDNKCDDNNTQINEEGTSNQVSVSKPKSSKIVSHSNVGLKSNQSRTKSDAKINQSCRSPSKRDSRRTSPIETVMEPVQTRSSVNPTKLTVEKLTKMDSKNKTGSKQYNEKSNTRSQSKLPARSMSIQKKLTQSAPSTDVTTNRKSRSRSPKKNVTKKSLPQSKKGGDLQGRKRSLSKSSVKQIPTENRVGRNRRVDEQKTESEGPKHSKSNKKETDSAKNAVKQVVETAMVTRKRGAPTSRKSSKTSEEQHRLSVTDENMKDEGLRKNQTTTKPQKSTVVQINNKNRKKDNPEQVLTNHLKNTRPLRTNQSKPKQSDVDKIQPQSTLSKTKTKTVASNTKRVNEKNDQTKGKHKISSKSTKTNKKGGVSSKSNRDADEILHEMLQECGSSFNCIDDFKNGREDVSSAMTPVTKYLNTTSSTNVTGERDLASSDDENIDHQVGSEECWKMCNKKKKQVVESKLLKRKPSRLLYTTNSKLAQFTPNLSVGEESRLLPKTAKRGKKNSTTRTFNKNGKVDGTVLKMMNELSSLELKRRQNGMHGNSEDCSGEDYDEYFHG